jgi:hypothetical protein
VATLGADALFSDWVEEASPATTSYGKEFLRRYYE